LARPTCLPAGRGRLETARPGLSRRMRDLPRSSFGLSRARTAKRVTVTTKLKATKTKTPHLACLPKPRRRQAANPTVTALSSTWCVVSPSPSGSTCPSGKVGSSRRKKAWCGSWPSLSGPGNSSALPGLNLPSKSCSQHPQAVKWFFQGLKSWQQNRNASVGDGDRRSALKIKAEQDRGPDFLRLANALSALYPKGSEEKRLLDAMLLAVHR